MLEKLKNATKVKLVPIDGRKSFYGKCCSLELGKDKYLKSYDTIVCGIVGGVFVRYWNDYSDTTMRHINAFLDKYDYPLLNKKYWHTFPVCDLIVKGQ